MTYTAPKAAMPLHIPLMMLLMLALAASTLLALKHEAPAPRASYVTAGDGAIARATPYGSSAALRNLLF